MKDYGLPTSAALHVLIIAAAIFAMPSAAPFAPAVESMPVEIITPVEYQQIAQGEEQAKPNPTPKLKVEKVAPQKVAKPVEAPKVAPDAVTPEPPKRSVPDQQVAAAEPADPVEPPPPPPKPPESKPQAAKPAPTPPAPPPAPASEPVKQAETPPKVEPTPIPQQDQQKLDDLALKAAQDPVDEPKVEQPKVKPVKVEPVKPPTPPKPEVAKVEPKPVEKPAQPAPDKSDPKAIEKLLAGLKTDQKAPAKPTDVADAGDGDTPAKPAAKPAKAFDLASLQKTLAKHPSTVPAKVPDGGADSPDALPSKEPPARSQKTGDKPSETSSLGKPNASAPKLSMAEIAALTSIMNDHLTTCGWPLIPGAGSAPLTVVVEVNMNADGSLEGAPKLVQAPDGPGGQAAVGVAMRTLRRCVTSANPVKFPQSKYASWKNLRLELTPKS